MKEEYWKKFMTTGGLQIIFLTKQKSAARKGRRNRQELESGESDCFDRDGAFYGTGWRV